MAKLWQAIRDVLTDAIQGGSTIPLNFATHRSDGLFYYGSTGGGPDFYTERLEVYDRAGQPCVRCQTPIKRLVQAARGTFSARAAKKTKIEFDEKGQGL